MNIALDILQQPAFWTLAIVLATPLLFGILGTQLCRTAGVVNLGAEGLLIAGAFAGHCALQLGLAPWPGLIVAAVTGALVGLVIGVMSGQRGPAQPLTGLAITLLASTLALYVTQAVTAAPMALTAPFALMHIPFLSTLPHVGQVLFAQTPLVYLAVVCAFVLIYLLARTPLGLVIRAVGDNPLAALAQGRSVIRLRTSAVMIGSALIAVGGACLTLGAANPFTPGMVHGRGWLCVAIALVIGPRITLAFVAALLLGAIDAVDERLVTLWRLPAGLVATLPYALAIIALTVAGRRAATSPVPAR